MFANEGAREWLVLGLDNGSFSHPLPKLRLRGPKLPTIATDHTRSFLLFLLPLFKFFLALCTQFFSFSLSKATLLRPKHPADLAGLCCTPRGEASVKRQV
jgi:hypothetical protein